MRLSSVAAIVGIAFVLFAAPGQSTTTVFASSNPGFFRTAIDTNATFPNLAETARANQFVILPPHKHALARELKAANPGLKVLVYKNLSFVSCDAYAGATYVPQGVRCPDVNANHPEWFLKNAAGNRLSSTSYSWLWLLDVGNRAYQDAWASGVISEAKAEGWDGIFLDDTNPTIRYHMDPASVAKYPNDVAWTGATRSMLANVGPRIQAAGLLAVANVCCAREVGSVWRDWLPYLSGAMDEMFTKWGNDPSVGYIWDWGTSGWRGQLEEVVEAEAQGKFFLGVAHSQTTDARAATYGLATMLLASQGRSSFSLAADYTTETWFPVYDRALRLGAPAGAYYRTGAAYRRDFAGGTVVVNPTLSPVRVELGAAYLGADGTSVTSVSLEATSAAVLLRAAGGQQEDTTRRRRRRTQPLPRRRSRQGRRPSRARAPHPSRSTPMNRTCGSSAASTAVRSRRAPARSRTPASRRATMCSRSARSTRQATWIRRRRAVPGASSCARGA